ncbi:cation-translocating P-type ATPase [Cryptosporangium sp. NPDC051539]|uniref:cation-translocating P-type ATPase n=1 Tax=Cryptosporangium sp. NPDC051539 TaxID=3363962 RepID=UPI0037B1811C
MNDGTTVIRPARPWARPAGDVAAGLGVDPAIGLTDDAVARRLAEIGPNVIATERERSIWASALAQLRETMILVLLGAAVLTALTGDLADMAVILLVVAVNTTVGVVQERRALGAVAALRALAAPTARVRRSGTVRPLEATGLVPGDVLVLSEGDVVGADARLCDAHDLTVDEALLTGESLPSHRSVEPVGTAAAPVADRASMVHGGTLVVHGSGTAVVTATGARSAIGGIADLLAGTEIPVTPLQRRLARLGRGLSAVAVGACAVVAGLGLLRGENWELVAVTGISLAVAAIPESLPAVVALSLAAAARRMARQGAIVRTLPAVETLGSITVLASDKTGTLTSGDMAAVAVWTPGDGELPLGTEPLPGTEAPALMAAAVLCSDAVPGEPGGDMTETAVVDAAVRAGLDVAAVRAAAPRTGVVPFDAGRRDMSTTHPGPVTFTKGAPEAVLGPADEAAREAADRWAGEGRRMLAVAETRPGRPRRVLGLIALADPVRPEAPDAIRAAHRAGIATVMITGDHPGTAEAIARRTGILDAPDRLGHDPGVGPLVHARADPGTKLDLIAAWRKQGHVVAMTGDGVNDAPALRAADVGVAMGRRGTDVARGAADLVLTDDSLATVVAAVAEGRRVFDNVRRFVRYGLSGGLAEILVMLLGPFLGLPLPLLPAQILWINLVTHGLPGVAIGAEGAEPDVLRRPPHDPAEGVLTRRTAAQTALYGTALAAACLAVAGWGHASGAPWQTMLFLTLAGGQLGLALATRSDARPVWRLSPRANPFLFAAVASSALLMLAGVYLPGLGTLLGTEPLTADWLGVVVLGAVVPAVVAQADLLADRWRDQRPRRRVRPARAPASPTR